MKFKSIRDSLDYVKSCPLCGQSMSSRISKHPQLNILEYNLPGFGQAFIDIDSGDAKCLNIYNKNSSGSNYYYVSEYSECPASPSCNRYYFAIQIHINAFIKKVELVVLNSETIVFERPPWTYEIKFSHTLSETECYIFKDGELPYVNREFKIPLIELNLEHPEKTLERIKNLMPFE